MNRKIVKMPILFVIILCICVVFVGCGKRKVPEGISQEVYEDVLAILKKSREIYTSRDKLEEASRGQWEEYSKYIDDSGKYRIELSDKEKEVFNALGEMHFYLGEYFEDDSWKWDKYANECFQKLSNLLEVDLNVSFQKDKIIIEGI